MATKNSAANIVKANVVTATLLIAAIAISLLGGGLLQQSHVYANEANYAKNTCATFEILEDNSEYAKALQEECIHDTLNANRVLDQQAFYFDMAQLAVVILLVAGAIAYRLHASIQLNR